MVVIFEVEVRLLLMGCIDCILKAVTVSDNFDGYKVELLGFCREERVYCRSMGEFVAVLQEALVCLAPVPPSFECVVYLREFSEVIHSV